MRSRANRTKRTAPFSYPVHVFRPSALGEDLTYGSFVHRRNRSVLGASFGGRQATQPRRGVAHTTRMAAGLGPAAVTSGGRTGRRLSPNCTVVQVCARFVEPPQSNCFFGSFPSLHPKPNPPL